MQVARTEAPRLSRGCMLEVWLGAAGPGLAVGPTEVPSASSAGGTAFVSCLILPPRCVQFANSSSLCLMLPLNSPAPGVV